MLEYAKRLYAQRRNAQCKHVKNMHSDGRYVDKDKDELVERLKEPAEETLEYAVDLILSHTGKRASIKYVVQ